MNFDSKRDKAALLNPSRYSSAGFLWILLVALSAVGAASAESWNGFRGLEAQGWAQDATPPSNWTIEDNALWSVAIPGVGHSSPVVYEDSVYLTSAYETDRHKKLLQSMDSLMGIAGWLALVLGFCFALTQLKSRSAAMSLSPQLTSPQRKGHSLLPVVLSLFMLMLVLSLVLTAEKWIDQENNPMRAWKVHAGIMVVGLIASSLYLPLASLQSLAVAGTTPVVSWIIFVARPDKRELFHFDSLSNIINDLVPVVPIFFGLFLVVVYLILRRSVSIPKGRWLSSITAILVFAIVVSQFSAVHFLKGSRELVRAVHALNLEDGSVQWICESLPGRQDRVYHLNSAATPTPVVFENRVLAYFGSAGLVCTDLDGRELWTRKDLPSECRFTHAASPVMQDGVLILTRDNETTEGERIDTVFMITGISPETGETLWEKSFHYPDTFANYSTPTVHSEGNRNLVWVRTWREVLALEPRSGNVAWRFTLSYDGNHLVASPLVHGERVYLMGRSEILCIDRSADHSVGEAILWRQPLRGESSSSPLWANGRIFVATETSNAYCFAADSGDLLWEERFRGKVFSSIIGAGDTVYFCNERGTVYSIANDSEFRRIAEYDLGAKIYASIAPVNERLLIRTVESLYCIGSGKM